MADHPVHHASFACGVATLTNDQAALLADILGDAIRNYLPVRIGLDDGGLKIAVGYHGSWTPPLGELTR